MFRQRLLFFSTKRCSLAANSLEGFLYHKIDEEFENIQKPDFNFCIEMKHVGQSIGIIIFDYVKR